ncbi:MAG: hypothetical protein FJ278_12900 [Planctomycetes bacterium]|nr:hypothetical protein [Planctomycetota bacterium]
MSTQDPVALIVAAFALALVFATHGKASDALSPWAEGVQIRPVSTQEGRHTIHSYFNVCPESPDGRWVLFYASGAADGHEGEVRILERATGKEEALARNVSVEDAHRAACQQWASSGRRVVLHDARNGQWVVAAVDVATRQERVLARDRQLCWGQPQSDLVTLYGCHWNPGAHTGLELLNVETGEIKVVVTASAVKEAYPAWVAKQFGDAPLSVFFPILSPDLKRVFFKMATPLGGDFRSSKASRREGLVCYDLANRRFLFLREKWGHPCWHPNSRTILEPGNLLIDSDTGALSRVPDQPAFRGSHPSISPDGQLFVTDALLAYEQGKQEWAVVVGLMSGGRHQVIHRFDNSRGARSWRRSHPHPVFSPDGKRIYYNVSSGQWTQLCVAEAKP